MSKDIYIYSIELVTRNKSISMSDHAIEYYERAKQPLIDPP